MGSQHFKYVSLLDIRGGAAANDASTPFSNGNGYNTGDPSNVYGQPQQQRQPLFDGANDNRPAPLTSDPDFDILDWHPSYQSCQRYFLDHAQHEPGTQALCALINIRLPFQWLANPLISSAPQSSSQSAQPGSSSGYNFNPWPRPPQSRGGAAPAFVSLIPYIRRLIITGFDKPGILHGFFGDSYKAGIGPLQDCERRNYLFAAKHGGWRSCKKQYDINSEETVPFMKPLDSAVVEELESAEKSWSGWIAMEDWMVGPRAPPEDSGPSNQQERGDSGMGFMSGVGSGAGASNGRTTV